MVEKILNITITRQQPKQISSNEIGVLTSIDIDEVLPGGAIRPYRSCYSYVIKPVSFQKPQRVIKVIKRRSA